MFSSRKPVAILHTIVRLPNGVFNPYTGILTNLLFFTKGPKTEHVWCYETGARGARAASSPGSDHRFL